MCKLHSRSLLRTAILVCAISMLLKESKGTPTLDLTTFKTYLVQTLTSIKKDFTSRYKIRADNNYYSLIYLPILNEYFNLKKL